jgi:molybdopterin molybdotransferase
MVRRALGHVLPRGVTVRLDAPLPTGGRVRIMRATSAKVNARIVTAFNKQDSMLDRSSQANWSPARLTIPRASGEFVHPI